MADLGITACPEWHNPAMFIAWIERTPVPGQSSGYPSGWLACPLEGVDNDKN